MSTTEYFFRGSRPLAPCSHIVQIETRNGSRIFRRCSLTAEQMATIESRLMELQHVGEIRSYLLASANDCSFPELSAWLREIGQHAQQSQLIDITQNTLFSGGVA